MSTNKRSDTNGANANRERSTDAAQSSLPVTVLERRHGEQLRVAWASFNGARFLDLRIYFRTDGGDWRPTRKGVTARPDQLDELIDALERARASIPAGSR